VTNIYRIASLPKRRELPTLPRYMNTDEVVINARCLFLPMNLFISRVRRRKSLLFQGPGICSRLLSVYVTV
jgi:hypothetical protein